MSKLSFLIYLNAYNDNVSTNNPSQNPIKWSREQSGLIVDKPKSEQYSIAPGENRTLFSGVRSTSQDSSTEYDIALKPLSTQTYVLSWSGGTAPNFRTPRSIASDATTQVTVTINGPVVTFTSTGGTNFNFSSSSVGDSVRIGDLFNALNQGTFKVIAKTSNSISIENELGAAEGPITLGSGFADQVQVYSAAGVQPGDTLVISSDFSPASFGSYKITAVYAESIEFYSTAVLPQESSIQSEVFIYSSAKQFIYLESDSNLDVILNDGSAIKVEPFIVNNSVIPGVLMLKSTTFSLVVQNNGLNSCNVFLAAVE